MENKLITKVAEGLKHLYNTDIDENQIQIQKTRKEFDGDLTVVVFPFLRASKKSPEQTAEDLGAYIQENIEEITAFNVVKGFLNFEISPSYWLSVFKTISTTDNFGFKKPNSESTIMVEYSSPNTNKPLHLGHLRNNFLGYSVAEILKANGHKVVKTQIINDRGIHICKSMIAWQKFGKGETPVSSGMKGDHLVGKYYVEFDKAYKIEIEKLVSEGIEKAEAEKNAPIFKEAQEMLLKWEDGDTAIRELWHTMNGWVYDGFKSTYKTMGVDFDELYYESNTYLLGKDMVQDGLKKGIFYQKEDNSVWADLSDTKMDDKIMLRGDGTSVYMTQDVGTALERYKNHPDLKGMLYTVGNEQNHHFKVLFTILKKLGYAWADGCYHLSYGMIELPDGKMKSREGTVVDADDLMEMVVADAKEMTQERGHIEGMSEEEKETLYKMIGMGGLKYFLLKIDPKKGMVFDPAASIDLNGNTGPFIQYAHARIQSLLSKAKESNLSTEFINVEINSKEQEIIKLINAYPSIIKEAGENYSPAIIANYTYELVKEFNNFYQTVPIFKEEDAHKIAFRLKLSETIGKVIQSAMLLLGAHVPNKM
jgi:arginyl-tRNA synthetase